MKIRPNTTSAPHAGAVALLPIYYSLNEGEPIYIITTDDNALTHLSRQKFVAGLLCHTN